MSHPREGSFFTKNLATSDDLIHWEKDDRKPLLDQLPPGHGHIGTPGTFFHGPLLWRREEEDVWLMVINGYNHAAETPRNSILLYRSADLVRWEYSHPLFESPQGLHTPLADFFHLGHKYVLILHGAGNLREGWLSGYYNQWYVGQLKDDRFVPENNGIRDGGSLHAVRTVADGENRRLLFGMHTEGRHRELVLRSDWINVMSLPRVVSLSDDDELIIEPRLSPPAGADTALRPRR